MKKSNAAPLPKPPHVPHFDPSQAAEAACRTRSKKPTPRERLASALLQQWLSYRSDLGQASADHFYALRHYTAAFLGADPKRVVCRRPDCSRVEV